MKTFPPKSKTETQQARHYPMSGAAGPATEWINHRPEVVAQRKLQGAMHQSVRVQALGQVQDNIHNGARQVAQRQQWARMFGHPVQRQDGDKDEARPMQVGPQASKRQGGSPAAAGGVPRIMTVLQEKGATSKVSEEQEKPLTDSGETGHRDFPNPARAPQVADHGTDARHALQRVMAPSTPVIQRFQLRKWHVTEQLDLVKLLGGDGPWDTDSLNPETKRQLYALLSGDSKFSSRTADLEQLKKSFESPEQSSVAKEGVPQIAPEVKKTGVSSPRVRNPAKMETSPLVASPSPHATTETSITPRKPPKALSQRTVPEPDKTARRQLPSSPLSTTNPEKRPTAPTTPALSPEQQSNLQKPSPDKLEAVEPVNAVPHKVRVARAMATIPKGTETSEEAVMKVLIKEYGSAQALVEPSKTPEFASALLESIRLLQSPDWVNATAMVKPDSRMALPGRIEDWTIRHYTNKATVTLADPGENGLRKVIAVDTPPFNELLSMVTLTAMRMHGLGNYPLNLGPKQKLHTNSSSKNSGHTSALDWKNIGNIGDTFYALFYKGKSATGVVPAFITDALYYAEWKIRDFGEGWASSDWLSTASGSKEDSAKRPSGKAVEGPIEQVIAHQLGTTKLQSKVMDDTTVAGSTASKLTANFENFEVKKHGAVKLQTGSWMPANPGKIGEIKSGWYDAKDNWTKG